MTRPAMIRYLDHSATTAMWSISSSGAAEQFHNDESLEAVDRRPPNNSKNWQWTTQGNVSVRRSTPAPHGGESSMVSVLQAVCSPQVFCYRCTNVGFVNSSTSTAPWIACKGAFIHNSPHGKPPTGLQWAHEHKASQANWHQVVCSDESRCNLREHYDSIRVRHYAGERCLPECVIERHSALKLNVMVWGIPGAIFQQNNARSHVAKTVCDCCSAQHRQLLPWPAYSPDMSPIEHVRDLIGWRIARDPCPAASKDELLVRIQAIGNSLPQADIQNLFHSMSRRIATLIAVCVGYMKY
ncbi:transposable element Tcb1 transposase [Trichonephila clavipes]|nr:transposable element Tcb1 transposase [Trichonephila clavipes]